jgi:hypothetical protein
VRIDKIDKQGVTVALSERNLKALLAKLHGHPPNSVATLVYESRLGWLIVKAEPDDVHYANPERDSSAPGAMHPETEDAI